MPYLVDNRRVAPTTTSPSRRVNPTSFMSDYTTHLSLLSRVRNPADVVAWREFEHRYGELLTAFCRSRGMQQADAEDVVQVVMASLCKSLPGFAYDPIKGRFRDYLYRCVRNAIIQWAARPNQGETGLDTRINTTHAAPESDDRAGADAFEQEWIAHHYRLAMNTIRATFEPRSVELFDRSVAGATVSELSSAFGMSEQAVYKVRQRIKGRMEQLIAAQIKEEDEPDA